jgi:hypothetical protein
VHVTELGLCSIVDIGNNSVETLGFGTGEVIRKIALGETGCENGN